MLGEIQKRLIQLYDLPDGLPVDDFVCEAEDVLEVAGAELARGEVLLISETEDDLHVGLYVDPDALSALREDASDDPWFCDQGFVACCLATEGVSHFVYLVFRAENRESVSQLELELQAEVDKYATGLMAGFGVGAIQERSRKLRARLFEDVEFLDDEASVEGARYRAAHRFAAKYVRWLETEFVSTGRLRDLAVELRRFYRLGVREKIEVSRSI